MGRAKVKFEAAILCDEIRQEMSGKFFLLGVGGGELTFPSFPWRFALSVYTEGNVDVGGEFSSSLQVSDEIGGILFQGERGPIVQFIPGRFVHFFQFVATVQRDCTLTLTVDDGDNNHLILTRAVKLAPPSPLPPDFSKIMGLAS
jgi:hypothetical protein